MISRGTCARQHGFALVITLALLAVLVLSLYALSGLTRVGGQISSTGKYQVQARQHALLALNMALGELQRTAGGDAALTGMAGIGGVPAGAGNAARHWCGVWTGAGTFVTWLASGASGTAVPNLTGANAVEVVSTNSVGADATDREHIKALRLLVSAIDSQGQTTVQGGYAYWVGDEGVKLSTVLLDAEAVVPGQKHAINQQFTSVSPTSPTLLRVESFEQMNFVGGTTTQRQGAFHTYGRTHFSVNGTALVAGALNVNSNSARYWSGVGATFARLNPAAGGTVNPSTFGSDAAGLAGRPFLTVDDFLAAFAPKLTSRGISVTAFNATMRPWLSVRSETFRLRAYGDSVNPADASKIESSAYCEAIVQRTPQALPGLGRRFVITYFRWLGPDDL